MYRIITLLLTASLNLPLTASITYWQDLSTPLLLQQAAYVSELQTLPNFKNSTYAFYSLNNLTDATTPMLIKAALVGIAVFQSEIINQNIERITSLETLAECQACGCYLGGLGGVVGMGSSGIGGGGYTYSSSSSGFGSSFVFGGGDGASSGFAVPPNPPTASPPPPNPPEIPLVPEPETWLTLAGALLMAFIWKWKKQKSPKNV